MIAPRAERRGLTAAKPVLVVGMAPSRAGHSLPSGRGGPTLGRLSDYAGLSQAELLARLDFANLLAEWPGEAHHGSEKWDHASVDLPWGQLGQRVELLRADLMERSRPLVVGMGGFVRKVLQDSWGLSKLAWFNAATGPGGSLVVFSPHPAGTNMWWNDPENLERGMAFWAQVTVESTKHRRPPSAVPLSVRSKWLVDLLSRFGGDFPEACVDWPWVEPPGRPQAYHRGASMPAAHVALEVGGAGRRPSKQHQALHSCDRGNDCVNPGHLRWGTELENRMDQVSRGRGSIGQIGLAQAGEITELAAWVGEQAERYKASRSAIVGIVAGRSWDRAKWETGDDDAPAP